MLSPFGRGSIPRMRFRQRTTIRRACDLCGWAAVATCVLAAPVRSQGQQLPDAERPTFRAGVETVVVSVTVRDRRSRLVTALGREDFRLLVDGRPVDIEVFTKERRPLMLGILLSTSQESGVARIRDVGRALVDALRSRRPDLASAAARRHVLNAMRVRAMASPLYWKDSVQPYSRLYKDLLHHQATRARGFS